MIAAVAAAVALVLTTAATAAQQPDVTAALANARRLIDAGEPGGAVEALTLLAGRVDAPSQPRVAHLLGVAYYHAGDPVKAVETLAPIVDRLAAGSIERREAEQVLGLSAFLAGRFGEAIPWLERTRAWAPDNLQLAHALGQAYIQTGRGDAARGVFAPVYGVPDDSAAAHLIAAQMMVRLEMEAPAEQELVAALKKDPRLPGANLLMGQIVLFRGRVPEAVALTERELAINPANAMALSQLGDAYVRQSKWDEAIAALQKSIWLNPYYSAPYILLGRCYVKKDQPAAAEGMFRRAIDYDPNNRAAHYLLAQVLQRAGRVEEAKREFEIAERLSGPRGR
jgi:tetratricopeptide (TPR) repeat protein